MELPWIWVTVMLVTVSEWWAMDCCFHSGPKLECLQPYCKLCKIFSPQLFSNFLNHKLGSLMHQTYWKSWKCCTQIFHLLLHSISTGTHLDIQTYWNFTYEHCTYPAISEVDCDVIPMWCVSTVEYNSFVCLSFKVKWKFEVCTGASW